MEAIIDRQKISKEEYYSAKMSVSREEFEKSYAIANAGTPYEVYFKIKKVDSNNTDSAIINKMFENQKYILSCIGSIRSFVKLLFAITAIDFAWQMLERFYDFLVS